MKKFKDHPFVNHFVQHHCVKFETVQEWVRNSKNGYEFIRKYSIILCGTNCNFHIPSSPLNELRGLLGLERVPDQYEGYRHFQYMTHESYNSDLVRNCAASVHLKNQQAKEMKIRTCILSIILTLGVFFETYAQTTDVNSVDYTNNAIGGNFFFGTGIYTGNISDYFSNPFYVGLNLEYYRNGFVIQFDDYIGFGKTQDVIEYTALERWEKSDFVLSGMINLGLGYTIVDNDKIMVVPIAGIGFNKFAADLDELYDFKNEFKPVIPHIKLGGYIDLRAIKLFKDNPSFNTDNGSYSCPRISFGYTFPISETDYSEFYSGSQVYLTLGFGGLGQIKG